jgi:hypothetical protein
LSSLYSFPFIQIQNPDPQPCSELTNYGTEFKKAGHPKWTMVVTREKSTAILNSDADQTFFGSGSGTGTGTYLTRACTQTNNKKNTVNRSLIIQLL